MDITLSRVCRRYGGRPVLNEITAAIPEGSVWAVLGASGAGKTTLLRLLLELERPDSGSVTGIPAKKAALFQEDRLLPDLTLPGNLRAVPGPTDPARTASLLKLLGLGGDLRKPVREFSGGMARRASLARALLAPGGLLVLDEPFTGLDEASRLAAAEAIRQYRAGRTLIYTAHDAPDPLLPPPDGVIRLPAQPPEERRQDPDRIP